MFQQNANKCFFVCVTNSGSIIPLFHKNVISHDPLQKICSNLARPTCKNKLYENKIKLNWLNLFNFFYYGIIDRVGGKKPPTPMSDSVNLTLLINK